jgi:hypothetical protein
VWRYASEIALSPYVSPSPQTQKHTHTALALALPLAFLPILLRAREPAPSLTCTIHAIYYVHADTLKTCCMPSVHPLNTPSVHPLHMPSTSHRRILLRVSRLGPFADMHVMRYACL